MATIRKKAGKWQGLIRRSFHKPISKTFISKQDAHRWARETERLIEVGQYVDLSEANKTTLKDLLQRYEREVSSKKRSTVDKYLIKNIMRHELVSKVLAHVSTIVGLEIRSMKKKAYEYSKNELEKMIKEEEKKIIKKKGWMGIRILAATMGIGFVPFI